MPFRELANKKECAPQAPSDKHCQVTKARPFYEYRLRVQIRTTASPRLKKRIAPVQTLLYSSAAYTAQENQSTIDSARVGTIPLLRSDESQLSVRCVTAPTDSRGGYWKIGIVAPRR
jgi:hypothetical protein